MNGAFTLTDTETNADTDKLSRTQYESVLVSVSVQYDISTEFYNLFFIVLFISFGVGQSEHISTRKWQI